MKKEINQTTKGEIYNIDPRNIVVKDGFNSRSNFGDLEELARQIKEQGVLNPISVQPFKDENGDEKYQLVDGERRYRAVMMLINDGVEITYIPSLFIKNDVTDVNLLVQQALRNEGKNFNEYEWGILATKLRDECHLNVSEIAKKLGKNVGQVTYWFQILNMKPEIQEMVRTNLISGSDLRRVLQAHNHNQESAYKELLKLNAIRVEKGKEKMSIKDLDANSTTIINKKTKLIKVGLETLNKYIDEYQKENDCTIAFSLKSCFEQLKHGAPINEIIESFPSKPNSKNTNLVG